ncbi:MAG TPA: GNAT family N-acetyltransferase [Segetibacter sp.]
MSYAVSNENYTISNDKSLLNINVIYDYLSKESYWAKDIPLAIVEKSIDNSLCFGVYCNDVQIGFARLITDKATFGYLADVFIVEQFRGKGLSKWLIETIHAHPKLQTLRGWFLATRDAHELYKKFGWQSLQNPARFMQKPTNIVCANL